jgi:hypothetical protein
LSGSALSTVRVVKKVSNRNDRFVHGFCFGKRHRPLPSECRTLTFDPDEKVELPKATPADANLGDSGRDFYTQLTGRLRTLLWAIARRVDPGGLLWMRSERPKLNQRLGDFD